MKCTYTKSKRRIKLISLKSFQLAIGKDSLCVYARINGVLRTRDISSLQSLTIEDFLNKHSYHSHNEVSLADII